MLKVISRRDIQPERFTEALALYMELAKASRLEAGCMGYEVCQSVPATVMIVETWQDEAALEFHRTTEAFARIVPQIIELSISAELLKGQVIDG